MCVCLQALQELQDYGVDLLPAAYNQVQPPPAFRLQSYMLRFSLELFLDAKALSIHLLSSCFVYMQ